MKGFTKHVRSKGFALILSAACLATHIGYGQVIYVNITSNSQLTQCLVVNNMADQLGGGTYNSDLLQCTVANNDVYKLYQGTYGGGVVNGTIKNSIV